MKKTPSIRKAVSWVLFPLTIWYAIGTVLRNKFFDWGILHETRHQTPTIGVGNLITGGTGKTPHVEYILNLLKTDYTTAMLSRGYKRKTKGFYLAGNDTTAVHLGDEPFQVAQKNPDVYVAVCENRNDGVEKLSLQTPKPQVVILDDVFQHRYIKPSINILLTEYEKPFFKDFVLPFGDLRECRIGSRRADIIVVTKSPKDLSQTYRKEFARRLPHSNWQKVFFSYIEYGTPIPLNKLEIQNKAFDYQQVVLFTGIAHPQPLVEKIKEKSEVQLLQFSDHHDFNEDDIALIKTTFERLANPKKAVFTTEKDASRLSSNPLYKRISGLPIYYIPIKVKFYSNDGETFDELIKNKIATLI